MHIQADTTQALIALWLWIPISLILFQKYPPTRAAFISFMIATLYLPERTEVSIPVFPNLTKTIVSSLGIFFGLMGKKRRLPKVKVPKWPKRFIILVCVVNIFRAFLNMDAIPNGPFIIQGIAPQTALTFILEDLLTLWVPWYVGFICASNEDIVRDVIRGYMIMGAFYMIGVLYEIRFSPLAHVHVYGFHQHDWAQVHRAGGYRPTVFLSHGLAVALFTCSCTLLSLLGAKARVRPWKLNPMLFGLVFLVLLALSNSAGALGIAVVFSPFILWGSVKLKLRLAKWVGLFVLAYPLARFQGWIPTDDILDFIGKYSEDRRGSLGLRFHNETELLKRAQERIWFGFGGFARNFVFDPRTGRSDTVADGAWVIVFGQRGIMGFAGYFGFLCLPLLIAARHAKKLRKHRFGHLTGGIAVVLAGYILDLVPNGMYNSIPAMWGGVLTGMVHTIVLPSLKKARQRTA